MQFVCRTALLAAVLSAATSCTALGGLVPKVSDSHERVRDEVTSGLVTENQLVSNPAGFRVTWIKAKIQYQSATDRLSAWTSSSSTAGQRSDADTFSKKVLENLSAHLSATEKTFNEFTSKHYGRFFGPMAPDIKDALTETETWKEWHRVMQGKNLDSRLRQWRSEANTFFAVSSSGLSDADKEYLPSLIQERVNEFVESLDDAASIADRFQRDFDRRDTENDIK